jgi:DNA-binding transcriptional LysR family regulator
MEFYPLKVFLTVAGEKSFSRAAEKLLRTQPAVSLAIQKLESDLQEKLIDRSGKELLLTDAGRIVHEYARRFDNLEADLENALAELRDNSAGRLVVGANVTVFIGAYRTLPAPLSEGEGTSPTVVVEPDSFAIDRWGAGVGRNQLRSGGRSPAIARNLHRSPGFRRFPPASLRQS